MTPRSIRRAAERQAQKAAQKPERLAANPQIETHAPTVSEAQLTANRANAEKSTGPRTAEGKSRTRHNAVRHGLTGGSILLPSDDAVLYENLRRAFQEDLRPVGFREELLVQAIVDHQWRLARIPSLEANLYAVGRHEFAALFEGKDDALLDVQVFITYEKHFRNLVIQQARLTRYLHNDMAELKALQQARVEEEKQQFQTAAALTAKAKTEGRTFTPEEFGFVFSSADLQVFMEAKGDLRLAKKLIEFRSANVKTITQAAA